MDDVGKPSILQRLRDFSTQGKRTVSSFLPEHKKAFKILDEYLLLAHKNPHSSFDEE
jgi:hypothetical protein